LNIERSKLELNANYKLLSGRAELERVPFSQGSDENQKDSNNNTGKF
jgi:hypothetical protein